MADGLSPLADATGNLPVWTNGFIALTALPMPFWEDLPGGESRPCWFTGLGELCAKMTSR